MTKFVDELRDLINMHSIENESDTPDFLLAEYLGKCLENFAYVVKKRDTWDGEEKKKTHILD